MIEPIIGDRQCRMCGECKPLTMYSPAKRGAGGYQPYCKPCRSQMIAPTQRGNRKKRKSHTDPSPTAWLMPRMSMVESLRCVQFGKWRGPVSREPLRCAL